jgi:hypothetical protein
MADQATLDILIQVREELSGLRKTRDAMRELTKETTTFADTFKLGAALGLGNLSIESTLGTIKNVVVGAFNAIIAANDQLVSQIERSRARIGLSAEAYQVYSTILRGAGQSADAIYPAFDRLASLIGDAANGNVQASDSLERLGLSFNDLRGLQPEQFFQVVARQLARVTDENQRAALAADTLGKSYSQLKPLIDALAKKSMVELSAETEKTAGLLSNELSKSIDEAQRRGEEAGRRLSIAWAPWAAQLKDITANLLEAINPATDERRLQYLREQQALIEKTKFRTPTKIYETDLEKVTAEIKAIEDRLAKSRAAQEAAKAKEEAALPKGRAPSPDGSETPSLGKSGADSFVERLLAYEKALALAKADQQALNDSLLATEALRVEVAQRLGEASQRAKELTANPVADELQKVEAINEELRLKKQLSTLDEKIAADAKRAAEEAKTNADNTARVARAQADLALSKGIAAAEAQIALIQGNRFLTEQEKKAQIAPLLENENRLIAERIALLEEEIALTSDEGARVGLQGEVSGLRSRQGGVAAEQQDNQQLGIGESIGAGLIDLESQYEATGANIASIFTDTIGAGVDVAADGMQRLLGNTEFWTQKLGAAGPIMGTLTGSIAKMFAQWAAGQILGMILGKTASEQRKKETQAELPGNTANAAAASTASYGTSAIVGTLLLVAGIAAIIAAFGGFRERGGSVTAGRAYVVGEKRPEVFVPNESGRIIPSLDQLQYPGGAASFDSGSSGAAGLAGAAGGGADRRPISIYPLYDRDEAKRIAREAVDETYILDVLNNNLHRIRA